jgi:hypothetical protein
MCFDMTKLLGMGRTKTGLQLVSILCTEGNCAVIGLGHLGPLKSRLKKEYSCNSTPFLGNCVLFYFEPYILPARRVRHSLLQYIL